ncbi:hypothetical protein PoB_002202100 [Plakobranchus ocellatus]|uniref:Uncharacterized protein n=1 Tax=Plakobranchus ocellatus TaxID=259542 RepID=A0AAV3ZLX6_9GAST|nr:hypothetical protein PoB_002202100 [Plakobranchus ocellatus]
MDSTMNVSSQEKVQSHDTGLRDATGDWTSPAFPANKYSDPPYPSQYTGTDNSAFTNIAPPPKYDASTNGTHYGGQSYAGFGGTTGGTASPVDSVVVQPGSIVMTSQPDPDEKVPDYMVLSVVSLFFCLCIGIYSVRKASNSRTLRDSAQYREANAAARSAKIAAIIGIIIGSIITMFTSCYRAGVFGY